ncbi:MAG: AMP-binding protein [Pseudomonadota bacterium]
MAELTEADIEDVQPASPLQRSMLYACLAEPAAGHYVDQFSLSLTDGAALEPALRLLAGRHAALRSFFVWREQEAPMVVAVSTASVALERADGPLDAFLAADRARGFELDKPAPMRVTLVDIAPRTAANPAEGALHCVLTFHHALLDGWSIARLTNELLENMATIAAGKHVESGPATRLGASVASAVRWPTSLDGATTTDTLSIVETLPLPGAVIADGFGEIARDIPRATALAAWLREQRLTFPSLLHALWGLVASYLAGEPEAVFGSVDGGRAGLADDALGMHLRLLPIRAVADPELALADYLHRIHESLWEWQSTAPPAPGDMAVRLGRTASDGVGAQPFSVVVVAQNAPAIELPAGVADLVGHEQADVPLQISGALTPSPVLLLRWAAPRLDAERAALLAELLLAALDLLLASDSGATIGSLQLGLANRLGRQVRGRAVERPPFRPIERFLDRCACAPDAAALIDAAGELSYADLARLAERYRLRLAGAGVTPESHVVVLLPRGREAIAAQLGILALGAAYVPLDPEAPLPHLRRQLAPLAPAALVGRPAVADLLPCPVVPPPADADLGSDAPLLSSGAAGDVLCISFTSGSTGEPKPVAQRAAALGNRCDWYLNAFPTTARDVFAQRTPVTFVDAIAEWLTPLVTGARLVVIEESTARDLRAFAAALRDQRITRLTLVPSYLGALLEQLPQAALPDLELCVVSGESLSGALAKRALERLPQCRLVNLYGSTEVAADACYHIVEAADCEAVGVSIGAPIDNLDAWIANPVGLPLPRLARGELVLSGAGLARGYGVAGPSGPASGFRPADPALGLPAAFHTGDMASLAIDGLLNFHGRRDRQLQINGQRVEPGAIETRLLEHAAVTTAAVGADAQGLYAGVESTLDVTELRAWLAERLPGYLLPTRWHVAPTLPRLPSGKLDRDALAAQVRKLSGAAAQRETHDEPRGVQETDLFGLLCPLWSELLDQPVQATTDFFAAGGDSLQAMRMIARVERMLGIRVPLVALTKTPRLGAFVRALCREPEVEQPSALLSLRRPDDGAVSVLCVHGDAFNLLPLLPTTRLDWLTQWGDRMALVRGAGAPPAETIAETAERYVALMGSDRPDLLVAACGAAVIAIEMARLLAADERSVHLVLMDLPLGELRDPATETSRARALATELLVNPADTLRKTARWFANRTGAAGLQLERRRARLLASANAGRRMSDEDARDLCDLQLAQALGHYVPEPYAGDIDLVFSRAWRRTENARAAVPEFWRDAFNGEVALHLSPAREHNDLLYGDSAEFVAELIRRRLGERG